MMLGGPIDECKPIMTIGGVGPGLFYAGFFGYDTTFFLTDSCPVCAKCHKVYAPPVLNANGQLQLSFPCYAGAPLGAGPPAPIVTFVFAGPGVPASGSVLNAIATGFVVGS
jgi:hypothetical protein